MSKPPWTGVNRSDRRTDTDRGRVPEGVPVRRTTPVLLVAAVAVAAVVGLGMGSIGGAGASVTATTQVGETHVSAASPSGELAAVNVDLGGTVEWSGFENDVQEISFLLGTSANGFSGADSEVVSPPESGTSGSANITELGSRPGIRIAAEDIEPPAEGETITRTIPINVSVSVSDAEGESAEYTTTHDVTVDITHLGENETAENGTGDDGSGDAGGEDGTSEPTVDTSIEWDVDVSMAEDY